MRAACVLGILAFVFAAAAARRWTRNARHFDPATRTWLLIALIFTAVAAWLQWHTS